MGEVTFFAVNRNGQEPLAVTVALEKFGAPKSVEHMFITHADLEARNGRYAQNNVVPQKSNGAKLDGNGLSLTLLPFSYPLFGSNHKP